MPARPVLFVVAGAAALALLVASLLHGPLDSPADWLSPIGPGVVIATAALWLFDRVLWRMPGIRQLTGRPLLDGTWHGSLATEWVDPETGQTKPPDDSVFLVVRQRFWQISVRLLTRESSSASVFAELNRDRDGVCQLTYLYSNVPIPSVRHRSEIHYGAAILAAPKDSAAGIEGDYFTDRSSSGRMRFGVRVRHHAETYAAAQDLLSNAQS
jgi:hypothetical protein